MFRSSVKTTLSCSGFHLLAKPHNVNDDVWEVSFLKARKTLFSPFDKGNTATAMLLALQYLNEEVLSNEGCEKLLPSSLKWNVQICPKFTVGFLKLLSTHPIQCTLLLGETSTLNIEFRF